MKIPDLDTQILEQAAKITPAIELTVVLKDSERTYRHKFLLYQEVLLHPHASTILDCIKEAKDSFRAEPEDIIIQAKMVVQ